MMEILDLNKALELVDGERELLASLLDSFVGAKTFDSSLLMELSSSGDMSSATSYVHFFKGAARQIYAEKCAASGQLLKRPFVLVLLSNLIFFLRNLKRITMKPLKKLGKFAEHCVKIFKGEKRHFFCRTAFKFCGPRKHF